MLVPSSSSNSMLSQSSVAGIRGIRQIKTVTKNVGKPKPSERLAKKVDTTYEYFLKEVDPLIGACITHLLVTQPSDVPLAMLEYYTSTKEQLEGSGRGPEAHISTISRAKKEQKVYLATLIGPSIAKLVNRIALQRPKDVLNFIIYELNTMIYGIDEEAEKRVFLQYDLEPSRVPMPLKLPVDNTVGVTPDSAVTSDEIVASSALLEQTSVPQPLEPLPVQSKVINIVMLGSNNAGKTSILNTLQGKVDSKIKPTIGFNPISMLLGDCKVTFYDLGGGPKIREIWDKYYHDVHGVMYVFDASAGTDDLNQSIELCKKTLKHANLKMKPLVVLANKQDIESAKTSTDFESLLGIEANSTEKIFECSSFNAPESGLQMDVRIEGAVEWLIKVIQDQYDALNSRVEVDTKRNLQDEARKRIEKDIKILRNKIACAFPSLVDASKLPAGHLTEPEDCFSVEDGLLYLSQEIGEDLAGLAETAKEIARLVGYQKLALSMVGNMFAPVNRKKKTPLSWAEIKEVVLACRKELGIVESQ